METVNKKGIKNVLWVALIVIIVAEAGVLYAIVQRNIEAKQGANQGPIISGTLPFADTPDQTISAIETNELFRENDEHLKAGEKEKAFAGYLRLKEESSGTEIEGAVLYRLMLATEDVPSRISLAKHIASIEEYSNDVRAHAIEAMGWFYMRAVDEETKQLISNNVFDSRPYFDFLEGEDYETAYIRLFELASEYRPVAYADAHIANYYKSMAKAVAANEEVPSVIEREESVEGLLYKAETKRASAEIALKQIKEPIIEDYAAATQELLDEFDAL